MSYIYWLVLFSVLTLGKAAETYPKLHADRNGKYSILPDTGAVIILSMILILVSGLRYNVGTDYFVYYRWSIKEWHQVWDKLLSFKEGGFALVAMLSRLIYNHGQSLIFLSAVITVGLFSWTIYKYSIMYLISILLYIFIGEWQSSFNTMRQCMAAAILFSGHRFILDRKLWQYSLVVLAASMFHITALIMIIPYFLLNRKADLVQIIILTLGAVAIRFSYDIIFSLISGYKERVLNSNQSYMSNGVNIIRILVSFIPIVIYTVLCKKNNQTKEQNFYINALLFNAFSLLAGMGSKYFGRVAIYTGAMVTIGYGHLFQLIDDERTRKITAFVVMLMYFIFWLYSLNVSGRDIRYYQWIFAAGE